LVEAAYQEFDTVGFNGTDTNRIARRAGFAPQTFYRWFDDKADIFIAAYELWQSREFAVLRELVDRDASDLELTRALIQHHKGARIFRRSMRSLSLEDDKVRKARANARLRQLAYIRERTGAPESENGRLASRLLQIERLADGLAEGEFDDMGLSAAHGEAALAELMGAMRARAK
jgi:AcrR family transcriptional regulator